MPPRPTLASFLATARAALKSPSSPKTLVVGNESADLDSLCSAILLAYIRTHQSPSPSSPRLGTTSPSPTPTPPAPTLHIPLANIPRGDFALRPEFAGVLRHVGLAPDDVPSLSDLFHDEDAVGEQQPPVLMDSFGSDGGGKTRLLLVDHNALTGPLKRHFAGNVIGCIDHHVDEHCVPADCTPEPRVVETVGSCTTLVVEYARGTWAQILDSQSSSHANDTNDANTPDEVDVQLARLALAPVLIDTVGLTNKYKTTPRDVAVAEFLENILHRAASATLSARAEETSPQSYKRDAYLSELRHLESDLSNLCVRDMLRKDYKQWEDHGCVLGVSAVVQPFEYIISRAPSSSHDGFLETVREWGREKKLDVAVVMTISSPAGKLQRELLVWALTEKGERSMREFESRSAEVLQLQTWGGGELDGTRGGDKETEENEGWRRAWKQGNLSQSRKQVGPLLREAVKATLG